MPTQADVISHFSLLTSARCGSSRIARAVTAGRDYRHQTAVAVIVTSFDWWQISFENRGSAPGTFVRDALHSLRPS
jgi:hypothetical protein